MKDYANVRQTQPMCIGSLNPNLKSPESCTRYRQLMRHGLSDLTAEEYEVPLATMRRHARMGKSWRLSGLASCPGAQCEQACLGGALRVLAPCPWYLDSLNMSIFSSLIDPI